MTLGTKVSIAAVAGAITIGGLGAAAYAGALPPGMQDVAHGLIGAPSVQHAGVAAQEASTKTPKPDPTGKHANKPKGRGAKTSRPVGPDATGPAAVGLCTAYAHSSRHGNSIGHSIAMRNLATAAGGASRIGAYCAQVARSHPSGSDSSGPDEQRPDPAESHAAKPHPGGLHGRNPRESHRKAPHAEKSHPAKPTL